MPRPASDKALITLDEFIPYLTDAETPEYTDAQKDNIQLLINGISEFFSEYTNLNIIAETSIDYFDGGGRRYILKKYPATEVTEIWDEKEDEEYTENYRLRGDIGLILFDTAPPPEESRYKITYSAGIAANVAAVPEIWKLMCASAVNYIYNKDAANFTRAVEGVAIFPRTMPPLVMEFLNHQRDVTV